VSVHLLWRMEERKLPNGSVRTMWVAWVVEELDDGDEEGVRFLAYMGPNPLVTSQLKSEFETLYPGVQVDWESLAEEIGRPQTDVKVLTFDELASRVRLVLGEYGLLLDRVDYQFGRGWTRPLREVERLVRDPGVAARFERTSGSIFTYLRDKHPEYAYALFKVRLLLTDGEESVTALEALEPEIRPGSRFRVFREFCLATLADELDGG